MQGLYALLTYIFFGEFGLLTMMPRYLFCVLLPVMIFLGFFSAVLERLPFLQDYSRSFFYGLAGLGCTTAALTAAASIKEEDCRQRMIWILILLIPCSSQIAMIAAFASMVTLRVFLSYLLFVSLALAAMYLLISKVCPQQLSVKDPGAGPVLSPLQKPPIRPLSICKEAFLSVTTTIPSFCVGSLIISCLTSFGLMEIACDIFAPWLRQILGLPKEAASLFIVNLFKRDFGSASLLAFAEAGAFDAIQMVVVMMMLTFSVPCFNSTVLLFKQEKLPMAILLWLGSFCVSLFLGRMVLQILLVCFF